MRTSLAPGLVRTTIRLADSGSAGVLRIGDRINVLAVASDPAGGGQGGASARLVAQEITVLALPTPRTADDPGGLVVVAASPSVAAALAQSAAERLSVTIG